MTELQQILVSYKNPVLGEGNGKPVLFESLKSISTDEGRNAWQRLIDDELIEWGRHPEQFEDDGYTAPRADNLVRATEFIAFCRDHGVAPPLRMAPDGEGGVVFEWKNNPPYHVTMEINAEGRMEMLVFLNCNLVTRERIGVETPA